MVPKKGQCGSLRFSIAYAVIYNPDEYQMCDGGAGQDKSEIPNLEGSIIQ